MEMFTHKNELLANGARGERALRAYDQNEIEQQTEDSSAECRRFGKQNIKSN